MCFVIQKKFVYTLDFIHVVPWSCQKMQYFDHDLYCKQMEHEISVANRQKTPRLWYLAVQVILFEIDCAIFYTHLHELFCQFISWTNWVNSGKLMGNCWISCQVMADLEKIYNDLIIINLYILCLRINKGGGGQILAILLTFDVVFMLIL